MGNTEAESDMVCSAFLKAFSKCHINGRGKEARSARKIPWQGSKQKVTETRSNKMGIERMGRNDRLACKCIPKCPSLAKGRSVPSTPLPSIVLCESSSPSWGEGKGKKGS